MSNFKYVKPKLTNDPAKQWASWIRLEEYTVERFDLVPLTKIPFDEWNPQRAKDLLPKIEAGIPIDPVRLSLVDGKYTVTDGNHRTAVSKKLGFTHVPAIVDELIRTEPNFPAPPSLAKELMEEECIAFVNQLRFASIPGAQFGAKNADQHGFDVDVEVEIDYDYVGGDLKVIKQHDQFKWELKMRDGTNAHGVTHDKQVIVDAVGKVLSKMHDSKIASALVKIAKQISCIS